MKEITKFKEPLVSVLMPAYNAAKFINQAISSILDQSYKNLELIILDDASTDRTAKIILKLKEKDNRIKFYRNKENLGYVKSFNKLIDLANGDLITSQDADDYSHIERIKIQVSKFQEDENLKVCGTNFYRVTTKNEVLDKTNLPLTHEDLKKSEPPLAPFCGSSFMLKKQVAKEAGKYHEFFHRKGGGRCLLGLLFDRQL